MSVPKTILITSASGNIGPHLVQLLLSQNPQPKLVIPTTNPEKLRSKIPSISQAKDNVLVAEGTVQDPIWFQALVQDNNVDTVFLCLTGLDEMYTDLNCLDAISRAGMVKKVIYLSVIGDFTSEAGFKQTIRTRGYPHLFGKILIEQRLLLAGYDFDWTVLGPTIFFSNDYMQKMNMMQKGELDGLFEHGTNKIALTDIALAARNAMYDTTGAWSGKKIQLGSKRLYVGSDLVEIWSQALGKSLKPVYATKQSLEGTELQVRAAYGGTTGMGVGRSLRLLFEYLMNNGISMTDAQYEDQVKLLGKEPDDYEPWVKETAAMWLRE